MATKKSEEVINYRNSKTGKFVTKEYVEKHPKKTETEHNPRHTPSKPTKNKQLSIRFGGYVFHPTLVLSIDCQT
jgi:phage pi2 protein 07